LVAEALKSEVYLYLAGVGDYAGVTGMLGSSLWQMT
jgi:hypothetical protein